MSQWCHSVMSVENDTVHVHYEPHCHCDVQSDSRLEFPGCLLGLLHLNPPRHHEYQDFVLKSLMRLWVLIPPGRLDLHTTLSMFLNSCKTVHDKNKNVVAILRAFKHILMIIEIMFLLRIIQDRIIITLTFCIVPFLVLNKTSAGDCLFFKHHNSKLC